MHSNTNCSTISNNLTVILHHSHITTNVIYNIEFYSLSQLSFNTSFSKNVTLLVFYITNLSLLILILLSNRLSALFLLDHSTCKVIWICFSSWVMVSTHLGWSVGVHSSYLTVLLMLSFPNQVIYNCWYNSSHGLELFYNLMFFSLY